MKNRNWFWGSFFLLSAIFVVLSQTWFFQDINVISILATVFLAAIIISSLLKLYFSGIFIPLVFLYMLYSKTLKMQYISPWLLISAAVLVSIGFSLLFPKHFKKAAYSHNKADQIKKVPGNIDENNLYVNATLNSISKYVHSEDLQGGYFVSYLGVLDVYFDQAQLSPNGAELLINCVLGSINLYIPRGWNLIDNTQSYLGYTSYHHEDNKFSKDAPRVTLVGKNVLGDIKIFYI